MSGPIRWADVPPPVRSRCYAKIISPVSRAGFSVVLIARQLTGVFTHYQDGRTRPCAGRECWCFAEGKVPRWKGYIPCLEFPGAKLALLELTEGAANQLLSHFDEKEGYRGLHLHVFRRTNKSRSPVDVKVQPKTYVRELPKSFDPVPVLLNLWGVPVRFTDGQPVASPDLGLVPFPEEERGNGQ